MPRHVNSRLYFYRITCIMHDGTVKSGIRDHPSGDVDNVWVVYLENAEEKFKGRMQEFKCEQLSTHSPEVKRFIKDAGIHITTQQPYTDDFGDIPQEHGPAGKTTEDKMSGGDGKRRYRAKKG